MKIYCIQKYNHKVQFNANDEDKWIFHGYTKDKKRAEKIIKSSSQIEIKDVFGDSLIPRTYVKEYRIIEIQELI